MTVKLKKWPWLAVYLAPKAELTTWFRRPEAIRCGDTDGRSERTPRCQTAPPECFKANFTASLSSTALSPNLPAAASSSLCPALSQP